jgi:hypothetical protein
MRMTAAVQDHFFRLRRQRIKWFIEVKMVMVGHRFQHLEIIETAFIPATDCTAGQTQFRIRHHLMRIKILLHPETIAGRARSRRVVERKQTRFQFTQ